MKKNYVDFSSVYKALGKTEKELEKAAVKAVEVAGEYASKQLKTKTPVDYDTKTHMKDHVVYSKPTVNKPVSEVGFDKQVAWRAHFVEFGTIKQDPQPFIETTMKDIEKKVADIIQSEMMRRLK
ncbi:Connector protein, Neck Ne1 [Enterococcus phage dArtagnan]|uniref:Connector protein, Neck Ne1 n=1 Tax=Enterococcus phage dArtagnan TaxID=2795667 RepID=A0A8D6XTG6_9CAUD|nr:Connector protein, Neck Ne1 [Enterococcus phage dArtagnan]